MKNPSAKLNQKSASFRAALAAEKKRVGEVTLDEPSTQRPCPANIAPSSAPARQFIHQVGTDERSIKQRLEEKSFANVQVRYPATGRALDFYNLNEATESETMRRRATVAAPTPACAQVTPAFKKSLHMRLTNLQHLSNYAHFSRTDQSSLTKRLGRLEPSSKSALRERQPQAKPEFSSATKSRARNLLDVMKVSQRATKKNELESRFVQTGAKATEQAGQVLQDITQ